MGKAPRRPRRPAAGERALGRQVLDARDDGHRPQPRPQRRVGGGPGQADRRRALRLRLLPPLHLDVRPHRARHRRRGVRASCSRRPRSGTASPTTPTSPPRPCAACASTTRTSSSGRPASPSRRTRPSSCAAPSRPCSARGTAPGPSPTASASASPTTSAPRSTCRRWCSATATTTRAPASASPATPPPARTALRRLPRQRPGRGRGGRHPQHRAARRPERALPDDPRGAAASIFDRLEAHYRDMCDTEFTIEQGKLWMLQTRVGKRTGAAALQMAVDMTKDKSHERWKLRGGGDPADHRRAPRPGAAPAVRAGPTATVIATGLAASPGRRRRQGRTSPPTTRPTPPTGARRSSSCATRPRPRTCTACSVAEGILTARGGLVSHAAVVARGWGKPAVVGAEAIKIERQVVHRRRRHRPRGRRHLDRRHHRRGRARRGRRSSLAEPPAGVRTRSSAGPTTIRKGKLAVRANADTGADAAKARQLRRRGHRAVPHRAHVPRRGPAADRARR